MIKKALERDALSSIWKKERAVKWIFRDAFVVVSLLAQEKLHFQRFEFNRFEPLTIFLSRMYRKYDRIFI